MTPSGIAEVLTSEQTRPRPSAPAPRPVPATPRYMVEPAPAPSRGFLKETLLESHRFQSSSKTLDLLAALLFHAVLIGAPILAGLYYTDTLNMQGLATTLLVAPPPPPPAPPAAILKAHAPRRVFVRGAKLIAPTVIPRQVAQLKEEPLEPESLGGAAGGVPGGVPGGQMGGVLGGVIGGVLSTAAKPVAPPTAKAAPIRVGGRVRPPRAIVQVPPEYPPLARQAHVQGQVQIDAVLDERGNVVEMRVVSGPPLLYPAAVEALRRWRYEPVYLNDHPVAVQMRVTVSFQLAQ